MYLICYGNISHKVLDFVNVIFFFPSAMFLKTDCSNIPYW